MKAKQISIKNIEELSDVIIDLDNKNRGPVSIGTQWNIGVTLPALNGMLSKLGRKINMPVKLFLNIEGYSDKLVVKKNTQILSIVFNGKHYNPKTGVVFNIDKENTPFQIVLNTQNIIDCTEKQQKPEKVYPIKFDIRIEDTKSHDLLIGPKVEFGIQFREVQPKPVVELGLKKKEIEFSDRLGVEDIGIIKIYNPAILKYYPNINSEISLDVRDHLTSEKISTIKIEDASENENRVCVKDLSEGGSRDIRIKAYFPSIGSPVEVEKYEYDLIVRTQYSILGNESAKYQLPDVKKTFTIKRNQTKPQLLVEIKDADAGKDEWIMVKKSPSVNQLKQIDFSPETRFVYTFTLKLSNVALNGVKGAGVTINNFSCTPRWKDGNTIDEYRRVNGRRKSIGDVFGLREKVESMLIESSREKEISIGFNEHDIIDIFTLRGGKRNYNSTLAFDIEFDYWELEMPLNHLPEGQKNTFQATIELPLYQAASSEWLGIDYGTSAIVCRFGDKEIDLKKEKYELYKKFGERPEQDDAYERDTTYLSSNVILRNNRDTSDDDQEERKNSDLIGDYSDDNSLPNYHTLAVALSPTSPTEDLNMAFLLPCMKMLVGYEYLPNIREREYSSFSYIVKGNEQEEEEHLCSRDEYGELLYGHLCEVPVLMSEVYKELFAYFVRPQLERSRNIDNIVLTVPNTFSPTHYEILSNLISESFRNYNVRNLRFVSESDSVACFYIRNWAEMNANAGRPKTEQSYLYGGERVLVYDMGAGTLDITYMQRNGATNIVILGRMGISKAGNYLDGVIASILAEKIPTLSNIATNDSLINAARIKAARKLKELIKNQIKPRLSDPDAKVTLKSDVFKNIGVREDLIIMVRDITQSERFKSYITEVTEDMLTNFVNFFKLQGESGLPLHTVVVSGRGSKLPQIKYGLQQVLDRLTDYSPYLMIDTSNVLKADKSKVAVVEGAMTFVSRSDLKISENMLMANYGVIYYDALGNEKYQELLNPRIEKASGVVEVRGRQMKMYDTRRTASCQLDISGCDNGKKLKLIQTYSANTLKDWTEGRREYITEMAAYSLPAGIDKTKAKLYVRVDEQGILRLYINGAATEGMSPTMIDVNSEINRFSMWPTQN